MKISLTPQAIYGFFIYLIYMIIFLLVHLSKHLGK